jgi:hypothetical protein
MWSIAMEDKALKIGKMLGLVIPILWITKEIISRGPQVANMECRETTLPAVPFCIDGKPTHYHIW